MSSLGSPNPFFIAGKKAYEIERSIRYDRANNSYFSKQPSSAGNRRTFTISLWVKRSNTGVNGALFYAGTSVGANHDDTDSFRFNTSDQLIFEGEENQSVKYQITTNRKFRDPSAWYHIVLAVDTTQSTSSNRIKFYVNGVQETSLATTTYPSQNYELFVNSTVSGGYTSGNIHVLGYTGSGRGLDGYLAEYHLIDGFQYDPSYFGETNASTNQWNPIKYIGGYGTNGFYLNFLDNSGTTATTLGKDSSGNGNNYTPNNFSVSAGVGNDSVEDTPTNNFATLNSVNFSGNSPSNGNLQSGTAGTSGWRHTYATFAMPSSGKWYWEVTRQGGGIDGSNGFCCGLADSVQVELTRDINSNANSLYLRQNQKRYSAGAITDSIFGASSVGSVIQFAFDADTGSMWSGINNTWTGANPSTGNSASWTSIPSGMVPLVGSYGSNNYSTINFGQQGFTYTPPTGYKALNSANLPDPTILLPNKHFESKLYTGTGSSQNITGLQFQPDWVWCKNRTNANRHALFDAVRGVTKRLRSDGNNAEVADADTLTSFNSDGFSIGADSDQYGVNQNGSNFVAWNWNAGGTTVTNTEGTKTAQVRANATAGFSIISYTGDGTSGSTVGHGLGVAPKIMFHKNRDGANNWYTITTAIDGSPDYLYLNTTASALNSSVTAPTSSLVYFTASTESNANGTDYIMYAFSEVEGYSKFGSYVGNNNADGTFVFTGFRPAWIMMKESSSTSRWSIYDSKRDTTNPNITYLRAQATNGDTINSDNAVDFLSNGFKMRTGSSNEPNAAHTYIYLAFAESPFKNARAR